jgi:cytochrome oxidase Cu insertion factor (SCO1/SenC/PrrC family)
MSERRPSGAVAGRILPFLGLGVAVAVGAVLAMRAEREPALPVLATIPEFQLTEASGAEVKHSDLAGSPWVADLIFTSCAGICPRMSAEMARLAKDSRPDVRFVSISVDPEHDTPAALTEYAKRFNADRSRWLFLTGDRGDIWELARKGFLLAVEEGNPAAGDDAVIHSSRFVLVDRQGRVRGTYDIEDREAMLRLRGDLARVD